MPRPIIDFHLVREHHRDIDRRLANWGRWCRGSGGAGDVAPMFRMYQSPARARSRDGLADQVAVATDGRDAVVIGRAVAMLPEKHRKALQWAYVRPCTPSKAARDIDVSMEHLAQLLHDGRQMLINRRV